MAVAAALADNNPAPAREKAARESLPFNLPDCPSSPALPPTCSALTATHFLEAFGFGPPLSCQTSPLSAGGYAPAAAASLPPHLHSSCAVVAHSLYSTCPEALRATRAWCRDNGRPFSFHLAECLEETLFLREGRGELHRFFAYRVLPGNWQAPGLDPTPFAERLGLLGPDTLAVHCTQCDAKDIDILGKNRVSCCLCPRSNARIGTGIAPARHMAKAGILLCLGTDGLSSAPDLDMGGEMRAVRDTWGFSPQAILRMATLNGAHALGLSRMLGSLEPGKRAALSFVKDM
jgi:cytosine/adenosine deaminase-related metal-dependent hydrolase